MFVFYNTTLDVIIIKDLTIFIILEHLRHNF